MAAKKKTTKKPTGAPEVVGSQKAYDDHLPAALALDAVRAFRADPQIAYHNVIAGLDAIAPSIDQIKDELPKISVKKLGALAEIALAVIFAAAQVDRGSDGSTMAQLARARDMREVLLASADALAASGVVPARAVEKIHEGRGSIDLAQDCIDLAALFTKHAKKLKGKTPVTAAQVKDAAATGTDLLKRLRPRGAKKKDVAASAVDARDRLWTLLVNRHRDLRRVGMWLWADEVDAHVPPLQSRVAAPRKKKAGEPAAPAEGSSAAPG